MYRTPPKADKSEGNKSPANPANRTFNMDRTPKDGEVTKTSNNVRRSIGEWEAGTLDSQPNTKASPKKKVPKDLGKTKPKTASQERVAEARACVVRAKTSLGESRNISTVIKNQVIQIIDRLFALVKEAEAERGSENRPQQQFEQKKEEKQVSEIENALLKSIEEQKSLIRENTVKIEELKELVNSKTYASVAAAPVVKNSPEGTTLHSVIVTSRNELDTGEQVLDRIRKTVKAKEGWVTVDRIRKAKDRKVIIGCKTEEEREKLKKRLSAAADRLHVEDVKNKDPLVIMRDVLQCHSDEEIIKALRNQNKNIFEGLENGEDRIGITYRIHTKNPHMCHIVARVSAKIWQRATDMGVVHIDLQRVKVADQSPLVQCSMCLGYGHGRRLCKERVERCSHCGGAHKKADCARWLAGDVPSCCNCVSVKADRTDHNAFGSECPIRRKWDALARATIAYC